MKKKKFDSAEFYKYFRIGIEVEGEFWDYMDNDPERLSVHNRDRIRRAVPDDEHCQREQCGYFGQCNNARYTACAERYIKEHKIKIPETRILKAWQVGTDGSIETKHDNSQKYEIRSGIIDSAKNEKKYIDELRSISNAKGAFRTKTTAQERISTYQCKKTTHWKRRTMLCLFLIARNLKNFLFVDIFQLSEWTSFSIALITLIAELAENSDEKKKKL